MQHFSGGKLYCLTNSSHVQMMGYVYYVNNFLLVVDGGTPEDYPELKRIILNYKKEIDCLIITHAHYDHYGAIINLLKEDTISVKQIIFEFPEEEKLLSAYTVDFEKDFYFEFMKMVDERKLKIVKPELDKIFDFSDFKIQFFKVGNMDEKDINSSSLIFKLITPNDSILFTGDTTKGPCEKLYNAFKNTNVLHAEFLQLAHHGQSGGSYNLYKLISPKYAFFNAPTWLYNNDPSSYEKNVPGNAYNSGPWTTIETRKWMEEIGAQPLVPLFETIEIE